MKLLPLCACMLSAALLSACQVTPKPSDTTNAQLKFRVHYLQPGLTTANVEIETSVVQEAFRCLYVASPFGVSANASDPEGISLVVLGPSGYVMALKTRQQAGDTIALPSPSVPTQVSNGDVIPNPGSPTSTSPLVKASYVSGKAFDAVTLGATYDFANGETLGALRGTVHNFNTKGTVTEVFNFFVRKAGKLPEEQPGKECAPPF